jgi:hypothetical protein
MIRPDFHRNYLMNILIVEFEWAMERLMWYEEQLISFFEDFICGYLDDRESTTEDYSMFRIRWIFWR